MKRQHNKNKYPFIVLAVIHVIMLGVVFYIKKDRKRLVITLFSNVGWAYLFDYIVLTLLNGYKYKPHIIKNKGLDNVLGSILSQAVYVPITALFITAFKLGRLSKLIFVFYFIGIERLFIKWRIFKHHWWKTAYTAFGMGGYFYLSDYWYKALKKKNQKVVFLSFFNMIQVIWMNTIFTLDAFKKLRFGHKRQPSIVVHYKIAPLVGLIVSFVIATLSKSGHWLGYVASSGFMMASNWLLRKNNLLQVTSFKVLFSVYVIIMSMTIFFRRIVYGEEGHTSEGEI